eukprot:9912231-Alexandrium_andersonii.AAC.1
MLLKFRSVVAGLPMRFTLLSVDVGECQVFVELRRSFGLRPKIPRNLMNINLKFTDSPPTSTESQQKSRHSKPQLPQNPPR